MGGLACLVPPRNEVVNVKRQLAVLLKAGAVAAVDNLQVQHLVLPAGGGRGGGGGRPLGSGRGCGCQPWLSFR